MREAEIEWDRERGRQCERECVRKSERWREGKRKNVCACVREKGGGGERATGCVGKDHSDNPTDNSIKGKRYFFVVTKNWLHILQMAFDRVHHFLKKK